MVRCVPHACLPSAVSLSCKRLECSVVGIVQPVILDYLASKMISSNDLVVVSPDVGGVARARAFAKKLSDAPLAIVDKRRQGHNISEVHVSRSSLPLCLLRDININTMSFRLTWCPLIRLNPVKGTQKAANLIRVGPWQVMNLIGDVKGKVAVMVDDMIDTAGKHFSVSICPPVFIVRSARVP